MGQKITQVDAFTSKAFAGNPAGVCVLDESKQDSWMQLVAREMNLAETAFLLQEKEGYKLRWFTPTVEVALCGHATLASAHVLWEEGFLKRDQTAKFQTRSGALFAKWNDGWIELDFPRLPVDPAPAPEPLLQGLKVPVLSCVRSTHTYLVELESEEVLRKVQPEISSFKKLDLDVIITARSSASEYDFVSRYFAPNQGIDEDPVTGSAHCVLTPYWARKLNKNELRAFQASKRGGFLRLRLNGDRVTLIGQAVTVLNCELV